jgi:hypothetical protein
MNQNGFALITGASGGVPGELLFRATTEHVALLRPKRPADAPLCSCSQCR